MQPLVVSASTMPVWVIYLRGVASAMVTGAMAAGPVFATTHAVTVLVIAAFLTGFSKGLVDVFSPSPAQEGSK